MAASVLTMFEETIQNQDDETGASPKQLEPHAQEQLRGTKFFPIIPSLAVGDPLLEGPA